ncbi:MAG TPA: helix-turn-helix transcriptional regulator [Bacteriovoracaceae bacterium]|nr:helix-turn-helix transcriptional regulator [Bacteriovoracaceae bacterium]
MDTTKTDKTRIQKIIVTPESKILKELRNQKGLSQRQLAKRMNISQTKVNHTESGRSNVTQNYITKFLAAIDSDRKVWAKMLGLGDMENDLRIQCKAFIDQMDIKRVRVLFDFISRF